MLLCVCHVLPDLDLSNNSIGSVDAIAECAGPLRRVVLQVRTLEAAAEALEARVCASALSCMLLC